MKRSSINANGLKGVILGLLIVFWAVFCQSLAFTQHSSDTASTKIQGRVKKLEDSLSVQKKELTKLIQETKEMKTSYDIAKWLLAFLGVLGITISAIGIFTYVKKIPQWIDKNFESQINSLISGRSEKLLRLMNAVDKEKQLLDNSKIVVWGNDELANAQVVDFLLKHHSKAIKHELSVEDYELIIINNEKGTMEIEKESELWKLMSKHIDKVFLYLAPSQKPLREIPDGIHVNFANSRITLFTQLITTLKFKEAKNLNKN